ncbi:MAG: DUF448 domain-containing protein [Epsilonproteobacteria bacterium]|nr:DUF448 domain-containing protein [Campylobacterota bacterium]
MEKRTPIRMCIACRRREPQKTLFRLQKKDGAVVKYSGVGRSFYICKECIVKEEEKLFKKISKILKVEKNSLEVVLKELRSNVKN